MAVDGGAADAGGGADIGHPAHSGPRPAAAPRPRRCGGRCAPRRLADLDGTAPSETSVSQNDMSDASCSCARCGHDASRDDRPRRRDGPPAGLRRGLAPSGGRLRVAALRRHARPRAPARAVDHDADDALLRARRAARAPGRGRAGRARAGVAALGLPRRRARRLVRAGRRLDRQARVRARLRRAGGGVGGRRGAAGRGAGGARGALLGRGRGRAGRRLEPRLDRRSSPTAAPTRTCTASRRCSPPRTRCGASARRG